MSQIKHTQRVDNEKRCTKTNYNGEICGQLIKPGVAHKCGDTRESFNQLLEMLGPRQRQQLASRTFKDLYNELDSDSELDRPPLKSVRLSTFGAPLRLSKTTDALNHQEPPQHSNEEIIRYWRDKNMGRDECRDLVSLLNGDKKKKVYTYSKIEKELNDRIPDDFYQSKLVWMETKLESGEKNAFPENMKADEDCNFCIDGYF